MGTQVAQTDLNQSKHQMTVSSVAAGAFVAPALEDLFIWVGTTALATKNQVEILTALRRCRDAIVEFGTPNPVSESEVSAICEPGDGKPAVSVVNQALLPTITEADVLIIYGNGFVTTGASKTLVDRVNMAIEKLMEDSLKAA